LAADSATTSSAQPITTQYFDQHELESLVEPELENALGTLDGVAPMLGGMARYHLGLVDATFREAPDDASKRGKRIRPGIALLSCAAAGGNPIEASPLAAAVELLHNFTLVHDDIQDESPSRRHRPTVWKLWGIGQAINAGDALFAAAQIALLRSKDHDLPSDVVLRLAESFNRMSIEIVEGQVLDLSFEGRDDVRAADYVRMIEGKTSAIVRYAAWGGALVAGASDEVTQRFADFGLALGLGFQIRDDLLGIWGATSTTGKAEADDIRRRKQSLPILLLREHLNDDEGRELQRLYEEDQIPESGIGFVLELLDKYEIRGIVEQQIGAYHDAAQRHLADATGDGANPGRDALQALVEALSTRVN
jgi:geranylgeranyl diphosphate synthase, type I